MGCLPGAACGGVIESPARQTLRAVIPNSAQYSLWHTRILVPVATARATAVLREAVTWNFSSISVMPMASLRGDPGG